MNFRVGQKVVCVNHDGRWIDRIMYRLCPPKVPMPEIGRVYTIANAYMSDRYQMVELVEHPSPVDHRGFGGWSAGFYAWCFRAAVDRPTDISIFTKMLTDTRTPVGVE